MTVLVTIVGIIIVVAGLGVWYDHRAKRHGGRTGVPAEQVEQHRGEVAARDTVMGREAEPDGSRRPEPN